ncbi:MAG TPA: TIGR03089 family protein [Nocardioidaceae bacterium]|nr:TIGR03089 family protein [Nocardioidaceae bacterium]
MPGTADTVVSALRAALSSDPGRPLVTFYDGATGERVELSVTTFDNWVTKVANLFADDLMLEPGDRIRVDLPTHWQTSVITLGAWTAGLTVSLTTTADDVAAHVVGPGADIDTSVQAGHVISCSLRPLGGPSLMPLPAGWLDFGAEVPAQPDVLTLAPTVDASGTAADTDLGPRTHADLMRAARGTASRLALSPTARLVTDANPATASGLIAALAAPLVADSSVVLLVNVDRDAAATISAQELVTASLWSDELSPGWPD